jgi:hypothetical protein
MISSGGASTGSAGARAPPTAENTMRAARTPKPLQARNLRRKKREGEAGGARRGKSHSWQTFLVSPLMIPYVYPCIFLITRIRKKRM